MSCAATAAGREFHDKAEQEETMVTQPIHMCTMSDINICRLKIRIAI